MTENELDELDELIEQINANKEMLKAYDEKIEKLRREYPLMIVF